MRKHEEGISLRKRETDFGDGFLDTEKLVQVLTAMTPTDIKLPSAEKRKVKTAETIYRVYAYRHRSRCLADFAEVMDEPSKWQEAHRFFLDTAIEVWKLYHRLKGEQSFSRLVCVKGEGSEGGPKKVAPDGVPDGIVFPMLSALSRFMSFTGSGWHLDIPRKFPWQVFFQQAMLQETNAARHNPQTMGKMAECYIALHGAIEMFFSVTSK
jgi:hypothetical protein